MATADSPNQHLVASPATEPTPVDDLNPLLNPILEENMGRWAQVYFTTPAENRQQAVAALVRELQDQRERQVISGADSLDPAIESDSGLQCPVCRTKADPDNRFCTLCGTRLVALGTTESSPDTVPISTAANTALVNPVAERSNDKTEIRFGRFLGWGLASWKPGLAALLLISLGTFAYRERSYFAHASLASPASEPAVLPPNPFASAVAPVGPIADSAKLAVPVSAAEVHPIRTARAHRIRPSLAVLPRLQLAEPPQGHLVYPASPQPGLVGTVNLKVLVSSRGGVKHVSALKGNRQLAEAATRAVRLWRYTPPQLNDKAAEAETYVSISFFGQDAVSIKFLSPPTEDGTHP